MTYRINGDNARFSTSTVVFLGVIILALSASLFLCLQASLTKHQLLSCRDYQYTNTQKICLIPEEELLK